MVRRRHWEHRMTFLYLGRTGRKVWQTRPKEVLKIEWLYRLWQGKRHDRVSNWNVSIVSVMDLNISGRWGKRAAPIEGILDAHIRRRRRWQFHSDVLVPDVRVQCLVLFQSPVGCSGDLKSC